MQAPSPYLAQRELSAMMWAPHEALLSLILQTTARRRHDRPVLVIPGLRTGDAAMGTMHELLTRVGYDPFGWGPGANEGYKLADERRLCESVEDAYQRTGVKVAIIGWSLGGMYSRAIAQDIPDAVTQVITLGTPHLGLEYTTPGASFERRSGKKLRESFSAEVAERLDRIKAALPVPCTSIFSRDDGIAAWDACVVDLDVKLKSQSIEVSSPHFCMPYSHDVFEVIKQILDQSIDDWHPHSRHLKFEPTSDSFGVG